MPISRTPRQKTEDSIFTQPTAQVFEDIDREDKQPEKDNDQIADLKRQLADMQERMAEDRSDALLSQPSQNNWQSQVTTTEVKPESIALPDPALDPDGYANAVQRRAELTVENARRRRDNESKFEKDIDDKTAELWADFGDEYPELSDDKERIDYVATQVVKSAVKRGLDINRYMFGTGRLRFMKDVAKKYESVFGDSEDDYVEEDNSRNNRREASPPRRNRNTNRNRQEDDDGRSAGVFGGNESGGRPNRREADDETGPSMIDDIQTLQRKTGFF